MASVMTESRNLSVVVPKLPVHISPQKSYNINDPSITPSKVKPRTPTAKEALARKMVKKAKSRANGRGAAALSFKRLMGDKGILDNSSDFVETGKTFQPAVRKLRSRTVKRTGKEKVGKPVSPDAAVAKERGTGKTSSMAAEVEGKEGRTCLTCKQTIFGTQESVKEHMKTCLRQRFISDKQPSRQTQVSDDESFARHLQQREEDKLMEEQLTDAEFYFCQICGRDLTHLNAVRRTQHINRCIDAMETEKKLHAEENIKDVPDCPICGKVLESRAQRQSHLKRCAVQYGVTTVQLLDLVKKQEEDEMIRRKYQSRPRLQPTQQRGVKRPHEGPAGTAGKRPRKPARHVMDMDERTQVAMAMSMSLAENDDSREQPTVVSTLPVGGKEGKRRKKGQSTTDEVPALLLTSKEDRDRTLAKKVASIIVQGDQEPVPKTPSMRKSKLGRKYHTARKTMGKGPNTPGFLQKAAASSPPAASSSTAASPPSSQEKAPLWSMTKRIDQKKTDDFYVQELSKQITPVKYVPVTPMRKAAQKAMLTFRKKSDASEGEESPASKAATGSQKAKKTPPAKRSPVKSTPTPTLTQGDTARVLMELAEEGCSTQEVQDVFTEGQPLSPEPSGFLPDRTQLSPQQMPSAVQNTALTKLSADFQLMVNSPKLSDLNLLCKNGEVLHVHKFVLVARCPVLAKMLESSEKGNKDLAALDFSDHHKDAVLTTLQYMYGGKVSISDTVLATNVMRVAQKLELKELEDTCRAFLKPTFSPADSSPEFQEKELPELLDTMLGSPSRSPNPSQGSQSLDSQGFNDSELEDMALSQKQRFQTAKTLPSKNVNKESAVTKKPTQMVPPAGRGLGQAPERQESGLLVPPMTIGKMVEATIEKNIRQDTRIGPHANLTPNAAQQPLIASPGQTTGVGIRIPVEHSYSTSPNKVTHRGRRGPKTTVTPMVEGFPSSVSPVKQPALLAPSKSGIATPSSHDAARNVTASTHAVRSTATLSPSQLGGASTVTQAGPAQTTMTPGSLPRPGVREQSLIIQSRELSSKVGCPECEKSEVRVSADEAQMLIQGGPAAHAMRQLILARQGPCPHGKFPSWCPPLPPTWTPPQGQEAVQGRPAGHLLAGLRSRTPPSSPVRQTASATAVTTSATRHSSTNPAQAGGPHGPRLQNFDPSSPPFGLGLGGLAVPSMQSRPGGMQPDVRPPGSRMPLPPPLPGFGPLAAGGRLPPASTLLSRTNILAQMRQPSQSSQERYGPQGIVQVQYHPPTTFPSQRDASMSQSPQSSGKEPDSSALSQLRSPSRLLLHAAQTMIPGNQYLSGQFLSPPALQRPSLPDGAPRLSVVAETSPPTSTGVAIVRIPAPLEKGQDRSERHVSPPHAAVPGTAGGHVSSFSASPSLASTQRTPLRSSAGATFSSASLNSSTADMFAVPDTPPSSGRPKRKVGKQGRGRTPSESDNDTRSAAEALMFMSQRREDSEGQEDASPPPPGIPGTQVHSASSPKSESVVEVSNDGGSAMPPSNPTVMHVSRLSSPEHQGSSQGARSPLIRPQSWSSLVRREGGTNDSSILKVLLQKGVAAAIPQLYKDQEVPPQIQKQVLRETRLKGKKKIIKQYDAQTCGEMVVGSSGEVHERILVISRKGEHVVDRRSSARLHDSHSGAQKEVVVGEEQHREVHDKNDDKQDELAGEESGTESLSCPTADELRDSMLCKILHPEKSSPVPKRKGKAAHDGGEVKKVQGKDLHAEKLTRARVLTKECSPVVGEARCHQKKGNNSVAAVCVSKSSVKNVARQRFASKVEEDTDCDELRSTFTGPYRKQRRGKAAAAATTFPSSSSPLSSEASPRGTVEIVANSRRKRSAAGRQEPDIGKVPSVFDNNQRVPAENQVSNTRDQGNYRVTRRASQRKKQATPSDAMMPSSVQTRTRGGRQKDVEASHSPTKRLRMQRAPEGKRHACTQSPKKFWTDYLKAQLASGQAPPGPVGESMMQTPGLSAVKPVRRGISSPELALTSPGMVGSAAHQPKFSTPVGSHTQTGGSPRLSLDQELKEAETETASHGTGPEPGGPIVENNKEMSLDSTGSQQANGASKGDEQKEASVTDSPVAPSKLHEACSNPNDSFTSTDSEGSNATRPGRLFETKGQEGPAVIVQTQSELLSPTIDFHEETIVPRSVSPTPPQSPLTAVRSRVSSPASPTAGPTPEQGQGRVSTGGTDLKAKDAPSAAVEVIEVSDDDDIQEGEDLQDDAKRKRSTPDSVSEAKRPKTDGQDSSTVGDDAEDDVECVTDNSVGAGGLEDVERIDLTQERGDETASESQQGGCGTEHGCGTPEPDQPPSPNGQSDPVEEQQSQNNSQPSVVNDSFMDFFDDGGYMEVPFGGEVECAAESSDDRINPDGGTRKAGCKDGQNVDDSSLRLDASSDKHTTPPVPSCPRNASDVIEEFPDTQQEPIHVEEDAHIEQNVAEVVEESTNSAGEDVVNNSMYDLEAYQEDYYWDACNEPQQEEPTAVQGDVGSVLGNSDTGSGPVKSTPLNTHHKSKAPLVPITPMPDYPNMETPELK
ncbi:5'-flap endonuclease, partial [Branchiostoma belcheri]